MQFYRIRQLRETKGVNQYLISRIEALLTEIVKKNPFFIHKSERPLSKSTFSYLQSTPQGHYLTFLIENVLHSIN
jgi:hypothetical protein